MSDTIQALNAVVAKCGERVEESDISGQNCKVMIDLIEEISVIAGDCLERHISAACKVKTPYRKERVNRGIVEQVAALIDDCDITAPEANYYTIELIQELLNRYNIEEIKS